MICSNGSLMRIIAPRLNFLNLLIFIYTRDMKSSRSNYLMSHDMRIYFVFTSLQMEIRYHYYFCELNEQIFILRNKKCEAVFSEHLKWNEIYSSFHLSFSYLLLCVCCWFVVVILHSQAFLSTKIFISLLVFRLIYPFIHSLILLFSNTQFIHNFSLQCDVNRWKTFRFSVPPQAK
jgi:hypothetical protein